MISSTSDSSEQRGSDQKRDYQNNGGSSGREGGYQSRAPRSGGYGSNNQQGSWGDRQQQSERQKAGAMEVYVDHNIERAMKVLKRKLIREGLFKELKARRYYEKPSERKKRKHKESVKKVRKDEARAKRNSQLF